MKIVINDCFGGFGLSHKAVLHYAKLKGITLYAFIDARDKSGTLDFDKLVPYRKGNNAFTIYYSREPLVDGEIPENAYFSDRGIPRDDPLLVQTVIDLAGKANGSCASLKIVEIPKGINWEIDEYDGSEHIAEKHRTWL